MDAIETLNIRVNSGHCPCYKTCFWWPGMAMQMQRVISSCERCIHHEGVCAKAPLQPILVTSPLELFHVDFTSNEMTMELDQPPHVVNSFGPL